MYLAIRIICTTQLFVEKRRVAWQNTSSISKQTRTQDILDYERSANFGNISKETHPFGRYKRQLN